MQTTTFDGMARELGHARTRREILRGLGGVTALGLGTAILGQSADARNKGKGKGHGKGNGKNKKCRSWILSGGPSSTTPLSVDDDLSITLNGTSLLNDTNKTAGTFPAIPFTAQTGDSLAVTATDANPACRAVSPLWLHCTTSNKKRQLSAGQNDGCAPGRTPGVFFNQVFTIKV